MSNNNSDVWQGVKRLAKSHGMQKQELAKSAVRAGLASPKLIPKPAQGHTPGPWVVDDSAAPNVLSPLGKLIAPVSPNACESGGQREANARLIAAAPDLLAACKALLGMDNPPAANPAHIDFARAVAMGQAAIAKAEGRAQ